MQANWRRSAWRWGMIFGVIVLVAKVTWNLLDSEPRSLSPAMAASADPRPSKWGLPGPHAIEVLAKVPDVDATDPAAVKAAIAAAVEPPTNGPDRLTEKARQELVNTMSAYVGMFSENSPDRYIEFAQTDPTTSWPEPGSPQWEWLAQHHEQRLKMGSLTKDNFKDFYRTMLNGLCFDPRLVFRRMGAGPGAARVIVEYSRSADIRGRSLLYERGGMDELEYWTKGGSHGMRFRESKVTPEMLVRRDGGVLFAQAAFVVKNQRGNTIVWHMHWVWNPATHRWYNTESFTESGVMPSAAMIF